jgi:hypothetical protein
MLTVSQFNPRQTLSAMLAGNEPDTKFIGEIKGTNIDSVDVTSKGVMLVTQGENIVVNGVKSYPIYISNTVSNSAAQHYLPNQINRVFYFGPNGGLHSHVRYHESWPGSNMDWTMAIDPSTLSMPDKVLEVDPSNPNKVLFSAMICYYKTIKGKLVNGVVDIDDIVNSDIRVPPVLANRIQMRIMGSTVSNEFRLNYDLYSVDHAAGNVPFTRWVFYINTVENCFTRIIMEDAVLVNINPVEKRIDKLDAVKLNDRRRTMDTDITMFLQHGERHVGKYIVVAAKLTSNGELLKEAEGWVVFYDGDTEIGTSPVVKGIARIDVLWKSSGTYSIKGIYTGDGVLGEAVTSKPFKVEII